LSGARAEVENYPGILRVYLAGETGQIEADMIGSQNLLGVAVK
jgi:hypothetical protein